MLKDKTKQNRVLKKKTLIFGTRGVGARYRHLMKDLLLLISHASSEPKLDQKNHLNVISEICELRGAKSCIFFEVRKRTDLYIWISLIPSGPTVKFQVFNIHTMEELQLTGNFMLNSRPLLSFDAAFDSLPHLKLIKELLIQIFSPLSTNPKIIPYIDRVYSFFYVDNKIWFRHYQVVEKSVSKQLGRGGVMSSDESSSSSSTSSSNPILVEIGPRFVLEPVKIFSGAFMGVAIWRNGGYLTPSRIRTQQKIAKAHKYENRVKAKKEKVVRLKKNRPKVSPVDEVFLNE